MKGDLNLINQRERLKQVANDTAGWAVLLYMEIPGDMAVLVPVTPALRGHEIVSDKPGSYDIWTRSPQRLVRTNLSLAELSDWLQTGTPDDKTVEKNIAQWTEEVFRDYKIPKRIS